VRLADQHLDGTPMKEPKHSVLAEGKVCYVGDHVALVVAETAAQAKAAANLIDVDYESCPPWSIPHGRQGEDDGVHDIAPDNVCYSGLRRQGRNRCGVYESGARHEALLREQPADPKRDRAARGECGLRPRRRCLHVVCREQNPHVERLLMTAFVLGLPEHKVRVVAPDVGGGFGSKIYLYARRRRWCGRASASAARVKWTAERSESFLSDAHGPRPLNDRGTRDGQDGKFLALRVHTTANVGAYLSDLASCVPTILYATLLAGQYSTPAIYCEVRRCSPTRRRLTPTAARAARGDVRRRAHRRNGGARAEDRPAELRRRNFIKTFPYATPVGLTTTQVTTT